MQIQCFPNYNINSLFKPDNFILCFMWKRNCGRQNNQEDFEKEEKTRIFLIQSKHYKVIVIKTV